MTNCVVIKYPLINTGIEAKFKRKVYSDSQEMENDPILHNWSSNYYVFYGNNLIVNNKIPFHQVAAEGYINLKRERETQRC